MLGGSNNTGLLEAPDGVGASSAHEVGVNGEPFPVATTHGISAESTDGGAKDNIDSLVALLGAHLVPALEPEIAAPAGTGSDTCRERARVVGEANAQRAILHAEAAEAQARDTSDVPNTSLSHPTRRRVSNFSPIYSMAVRAYPTPVVMLTFSRRVSWETKSLALE